MTRDWEIYRLDGPDLFADVSQGVADGVHDIEPSRSANSEWVVFTSNRTGNWELFLTRSDGSDLRQLSFNTQAMDIDPAWGPGNLLAFESSRDGNWEIYLFDVQTGIEVRLTAEPASDINAYWMPDGRSVVFQSDRSDAWQIYRFDLDTAVTTLLSDGTTDDRDPVVSPDGRQIAFRSSRGADADALYLMNADGSDVRQISEPAERVMNPAWSPDGSLIAYESNVDSDLDIYVFELASGLTRQVTDNAIADYAPTWRCGLTSLVFTSDASGDANLFEMSALPMDAPPADVLLAASQLTFSGADDVYPVDTQSEEDASREGRVPSPGSEQNRSFVPAGGDFPPFPRIDLLSLALDTTSTRPGAWDTISVCSALP
ncbi:MAG: PD40 domain-containing protein [Chloroflexi bacterium]|nr:PD40 domain-containing protein [Chloroflexota bacterium]